MKFDLGQVQFSGYLALNHRPVFVDQKVIICVLCFNVCCLFRANFCLLSARENCTVLVAIYTVKWKEPNRPECLGGQFGQFWAVLD